MLTLLVPLSAGAQWPVVSTFFGTGQSGFVNGSQDTARFNHPFGLSTGYQGQVFIADADNHCIRVINTAGLAETYAGTGSAGYLDGPVSQAKFNAPSDIWADPDSNIVYVCDFQNQRIRKIANGMVTTFAGSGQAGYLDGAATTARFNYPRGICRDPQGNLYIGDSWNHRIRKITPDGNVTTYAGGGIAIGVGSVGALVDAQGTDARFYTPSGLTMDEEGNIYVADAYNHRIRKIDPQQNVTTFAGSGPTGVGQGGYVNGPPLSARFNTPTEVKYFGTYCPGDAPALFIADTYNNRIRMMREDAGPWDVISYAGSGIAGYQNGPADSARFNWPRAITGWFGNASCALYVADYNNHSIRLLQDVYTGMAELPGKEGFSLWPNPASAFIQMEIPEKYSSSCKIVVKDVRGQELIKTLTNKNETLDISKLSAGLYFITVLDPNKPFITKKFIKL